MAVDAFLWFTGEKLVPQGETQDETFKNKNAFEIKDFSFSIESPHSVGSASGGAGAGKAKFNEFTIKKVTDKSSPVFLAALGSGIHYTTACVAVRKSGADAGEASGKPYLIYSFGMVFVTKLDWSGPGDEGPEESIAFTYGQFGISYSPQKPDGSLGTAVIQGWSQTANKKWDPPGT
jgi:type VI secretion system secreted protein Hcp